MNFTNDILIGRFTLAAGISALVQVTLLVLMFTVSRQPFGTMSDYFYVLTPLLILPLYFVLPRIMGNQNAVLGQSARIAGIIGIAVASLAEVALLLKVIDFRQSVWGNSIGLGLIGIPILAFALLSLGNSTLPVSFNWFGVALGIFMVIGIPAVFFFINEFFALGHGGGLDWAKANPLLYPAVLAGILTQIGLPVWLLWAARLMLSGNFKLIS